MVKKTGAPDPKKEETEAAFSHLDVNEDGKISRDEMQGIKKEIENIQKEKATQGFKEMDLDGDGILSRVQISQFDSKI